jgi:hypothetical protein
MLITRNDLQLQFPRDTVDGEEAPMSMSMASLKRSDEVEVVVVVRRVWGQRKWKAQQEQVAVVKYSQ